MLNIGHIHVSQLFFFLFLFLTNLVQIKIGTIMMFKFKGENIIIKFIDILDGYTSFRFPNNRLIWSWCWFIGHYLLMHAPDATTKVASYLDVTWSMLEEVFFIISCAMMLNQLVKYWFDSLLSVDLVHWPLSIDASTWCCYKSSLLTWCYKVHNRRGLLYNFVCNDVKLIGQILIRLLVKCWFRDKILLFFSKMHWDTLHWCYCD